MRLDLSRATEHEIPALYIGRRLHTFGQRNVEGLHEKRSERGDALRQTGQLDFTVEHGNQNLSVSVTSEVVTTVTVYQGDRCLGVGTNRTPAARTVAHATQEAIDAAIDLCKQSVDGKDPLVLPRLGDAQREMVAALVPDLVARTRRTRVSKSPPHRVAAC